MKFMAHVNANSCDILDFKKSLWKYNLVEVDMVLFDDKDRTNFTLIRNLRLLKPSKERDYIYLPLQLSHFGAIRRFMPVDK